MTLQNIVPAHPFSGVTAALQGLRERAVERAEMKAVYNKTWRELSAMSNRDLADIGLHRSDIPRVATEAANMK